MALYSGKDDTNLRTEMDNLMVRPPQLSNIDARRSIHLCVISDHAHTRTHMHMYIPSEGEGPTTVTQILVIRNSGKLKDHVVSSTFQCFGAKHVL